MRRGHTLIEVTVFAALLMLLSYALYGVLIASVRYQRIADASVNAKQNAVECMNHVVHELGESHAGAVKWDTSVASTPMLIFASPRDKNGFYHYDSSHNLYFQKWVGYYVDASQTPSLFVRVEKAMSAPVTKPTAPSGMATTLLGLGAQAQHAVGFNVVNFVAQPNSGATCWQIDLTFTDVELHVNNTFSFESSVSPAN
jgi:type II secretory pathway pseudopilin PulG